MNTDKPQDWDIARAYGAVSSSGAMMPYSDAEMVMSAFDRSQMFVMYELEKLLPSLPDASQVAPAFHEGLDCGLWFGAPEWPAFNLDEELLEADNKKAWEAFWLKGAKFEEAFSASLEYDLTPEHTLWETREGLPWLAGFSIDWDFKNNLVNLKLSCWSCGCSWDGSTHACSGLRCEVNYKSSFMPSSYLEEAVFTIGSFLKAHYAKHGWAWYGR